MQATLEEVVEADLLLHVLDASSPNVGVQREAVYKVLQQLGIAENRLKTKLVEVWNKSDLIQTARPPECSEDTQSPAPSHYSADSSSNVEVTATSLRSSEENQQGTAERLQAQSPLSSASQEAAVEEDFARPAIEMATAVEPPQVALDRRKAERDPLQAAQQDLVWELIKVFLLSPPENIDSEIWAHPVALGATFASGSNSKRCTGVI